MDKQIDCRFYFEDLHTNRKRLFEEALNHAKSGKVLYILHDELEELPQLSQEISTNRHYMKMISFLYVKTLESLIESLSTLPDWQNIPSSIILDDITAYSNNLHTVCGLTALLMDSVRSCHQTLEVSSATICISATKGVFDDEQCIMLKELYMNQTKCEIKC